MTALLALCLLTAPPGGRVIVAEHGADGREYYRIPIVIQTGESAVNVEGGVVLTWNRAGRILRADAFDAAGFGRLSGQSPRLGAGQQVIFGDTQTWWAVDQVSHTVYLFRCREADGTARRLIHWCRLGAGDDDPPLPATEATAPRLAVVPVPDQIEATPTAAGLRWAFDLQLQETGGVGVTIEQVSWQARDADGGVLADETLEGAALAEALAGGTPVCGPDGVLRLAGREVVAPETTLGGEVAVMVKGTAGGRTQTVLARLELLPPAPAPEPRTSLRLPFRGAWHVALGPGQPPFLGRQRHTWVFDAVGRDGKPFNDDGDRLREHHCWNRTVHAPAAGLVLVAHDEEADAYTPVGGGRFTGAGGVNEVIIDHGGGEYSYLAGFAQDSVVPLPRQRVEAGAELGRIGCNGTPLGRPALLYRLVAEPVGAPDGASLPARFQAFLHLAPGGRRNVTAGVPAAGDLIEQR